jgi:4-amino-4-deoxy-L-arabinose transferase-like glycosyltransferase
MSPEAVRVIRESGRIGVPRAWLLPARIAMICCVSAASLCLFLLGRSLAGGLPALAMSAALPLHPIANEAMNHALADAPALLLSAASALALAGCLKNLRLGFRFSSVALLSAVAGALAGLACAAKMNSLVMVFLAAGGFGLSLARRSVDGASPRRTIGLAAVFASVAAVVFLAVNPALHGDWSAGLVATFGEHRRTAEIQAGFLTGRLDGAGERLGAIGTLVGFNRWSWIPLLLCAVAVGFAGTARHRFVAGWWILAWIAVSWWIPFLRLRYAAPVLLPSLLLLGSAGELAVTRIVTLRGRGGRGSVAA